MGRETDQVTIREYIRSRLRNNPRGKRLMLEVINDALDTEELPEGGSVYMRQSNQGKITGRTHDDIWR